MKIAQFFLIILLSLFFSLNLYCQKEDKKILFGVQFKMPEIGIAKQNEHITFQGTNGKIRPSIAMSLELNGQIILNNKWDVFVGAAFKLRDYNIQSNILLEDWKELAMINRPLPLEEWDFSLSKVSTTSSFLVIPIGIKYNLYQRNINKKYRPFLGISFQPHFRFSSTLNAKYTKPQPGFLFGNDEKRDESSFNKEILEVYQNQFKDQVYAIAPSFGITPVHGNLGFEIAFPIFLSQFDKDLTTHYFSVQMSAHFYFRKKTIVKKELSKELSSDDKLFGSYQ